MYHTLRNTAWDATVQIPLLGDKIEAQDGPTSCLSGQSWDSNPDCLTPGQMLLTICCPPSLQLASPYPTWADLQDMWDSLVRWLKL